MRAELQKLNSRLEAMSREDLILSIQRLTEECAQKDAQLQINSEAATEMSKQFHKLRDENASLKKENKELLRQNRNLSDQLRMRGNDLFGRRSEKSSGLVDAILDQAPEDPVNESSPEPDETQKPDTSERSDAYRKALHADGQGKRQGKKIPGKREKDLSRLPSHTLYDCDIDDLDRRYGEGNWRIAFWRREDTIESVHSTQYRLIRYRPVISSGLEHELTSPYPCTKLLPGSLASESLVAELMYQKVVQCVPSYRMEADFIRGGIPLSRQTVTNWINRFCHEFLAMVAEYMGSILITRDHNQCDETVYKVIRDGRKAGSTSFIWVHTTSELDPDHPVIVFRYKLTRGTDHLRAFYGDTGYKGVITSDAYCSYDILEKEYPDIHGSGCLMHARRKFYYAAMVIGIMDSPRRCSVNCRRSKR